MNNVSHGAGRRAPAPKSPSGRCLQRSIELLEKLDDPELAALRDALERRDWRS